MKELFNNKTNESIGYVNVDRQINHTRIYENIDEATYFKNIDLAKREGNTIAGRRNATYKIINGTIILEDYDL